VIKRKCPLCGKEHFSAVEQEPWNCNNCGYYLTPEMNEFVSSSDLDKVKINPVAFRYFMHKSQKSISQITSNYQVAANLRKILEGEIDMISPELLQEFASKTGAKVEELIPDERSNRIIREFIDKEDKK